MADKLNQVAIRMIEQPPLLSKEPMDSPEAAIRVMQEFLSEMDRELFCSVFIPILLKKAPPATNESDGRGHMLPLNYSDISVALCFGV